MRGYTTFGTNAAGTATKTAVTITASASVRPSLYELLVGNSGTPGDNALQLAVRRFTAAGTAGSSPTPSPVDPGDVAAVATAGAAHSAEPTYSGTLLPFSINQRATFRWVAMPGFELKAPATSANGLGVQLVAAGASLSEDATVSWWE